MKNTEQHTKQQTRWKHTKKQNILKRHRNAQKNTNNLKTNKQRQRAIPSFKKQQKATIKTQNITSGDKLHRKTLKNKERMEAHQKTTKTIKTL